MGRSPCCDKIGLKKGPWTPEEDEKLLAFVQQNGHGSWRALPLKAGLERCGKSCRLRWINYLRPDIKRGKFSLQEEQTIIQLHALLGNRWSAIATHLPKRTDNEIKNYWNTHLKKRLAKMGLDPLTHKPRNETLALLSSDGQAKNTAKLSHMAQWESARLEAEARLARQSKLPTLSPPLHNPSPYLDVLKALTGATAWENTALTGVQDAEISQEMELLSSAGGIRDRSSTAFLQLAGENRMKGKVERESDLTNLAALTDGIDNPIKFPLGSIESPLATGSVRANTSDQYVPCGNFIETFTDLLLSNSSADRRHSDDGGESDNSCGSGGDGEGNYWDSVLNLVNSSPSDLPIF